ncbi:F-box/WD repeat-containing protein pof10 [Heracleum sosnowskyi]|uniref:F-box protein n=1 Tax=Heracleum sosnowskyi TaxID=360622 RepID=A0AAD8HFW1_9APIA|nr:F-box/WD repeat-containing protein pof10 [Heracleum sosnowskyi]
MERLPADICLKIFCFLDHQSLATAHQVCRRWKLMSSENILWSNLFEGRWGTDSAAFYAPTDSKSWKDVYIVQDRCDRIGLGLKIICEGDECYLVHQGEIQRHLGSRKQEMLSNQHSDGELAAETSLADSEPSVGILDKILFFLGDLEAASVQAKRARVI